MSRRTLRLADDDAGLAQAAALLRAGELVAFPTETVYGLGADATDEAAVAAIYAAKKRPSFNPLIAHYATVAVAFDDVTPTAAAERLAAAFWPGPLTMVLPRQPRSAVARLAGAGLDTQAVRVPAHPIAHRLLAAVIDGGACTVGLESTVVDLSGARPALLRAGGVTLDALRGVLPEIVAGAAYDLAAPRSPGQLLTHYAPDLPLRMNATETTETEALLAFGPPLPGAGLLFNLSEAGDLAEAAARLFAGLRWLDAQGRARGLRGIAAMAVPQSGLGVAINDRLNRAAFRS
jgi:L-threonylcarbamoyladenylate synthase